MIITYYHNCLPNKHINFYININIEDVYSLRLLQCQDALPKMSPTSASKIVVFSDILLFDMSMSLFFSCINLMFCSVSKFSRACSRIWFNELNLLSRICACSFSWRSYGVSDRVFKSFRK